VKYSSPWADQGEKFSVPIHVRRVQAAGATSLTKPLMRISSIKTTAINPYTATKIIKQAPIILSAVQPAGQIEPNGSAQSAAR